MSKASIIVKVNGIDEILKGVVKKTGNGAYVGVDKKYLDRKVKILILSSEGKEATR